jgi:hypothetical protein
MEPNILKAHSKAQLWTRNKMLKHLKEVFPFQGLDPENFIVEMLMAERFLCQLLILQIPRLAF